MENKEIDILESINFHPTHDEIQSEPLLAIEEIQEKNFEILNAPEEISMNPLETNIQTETEPEQAPIKKQTNKVIAGCIFVFKYLLSSSVVFGTLMIATNYSAYYNVIQSYVNSQALNDQSKGIISSVEASNVKDKIIDDTQKDISGVEQEANNKEVEYSIDKLLALSSKKDINLGIEITPYENRIVIPTIGKNIPLIEVKDQTIKGQKELNNIFMQELEKGVIRYPGSALPGENGNSFIFGHSSNFPWIKGDYNDVFALLNNVKYDDEVIVYYNQEKYTYKIREKRVVQPGDTSVIKAKKDKSEISIMTCWPIGTTLNRLIVKGELVKVD